MRTIIATYCYTGQRAAEWPSWLVFRNYAQS